MRTLYLQHVDTDERQAITIGLRLHIGRSPHNAVVLRSSDVSWSHAVLHIEAEQLVAEDLGSSNGTWVDGDRIDRPTVVNQHVRIGDYVLTLRDDTIVERQPSQFLLEDVHAQIQYALGEGSFVVGDVAGANIRVLGRAPEVAAVVDGVLHIRGSPTPAPWTGTLGGVMVRVFTASSLWSETLPDTTRFAARRMKISLDPPSALVIDLEACKTHTITAPNRVSLLFFLAQCADRDREEGVPADRVGWRPDEDAAVAVWGRSARGGPRNKLNTLTYRVRQELKDHGLSDVLLEKTAGWVRLSGCDVERT